MSELADLIKELLVQITILLENIKHLRKSRIELFSETWIDTSEVLKMLNISVRTLQNLRDSGELGHSRMKGKLYYKVSDVERMLNNNYQCIKKS